jgi:hypothetical protein
MLLVAATHCILAFSDDRGEMEQGMNANGQPCCGGVLCHLDELLCVSCEHCLPS